MCKRGFLVGKCADAKLKEEVRVEASIGDGKLALDVSSSSSNSSSSSSSNANKNGRRSEAFTVKLSNTACALSLYNKASKLFYQVIRKVYQWQRQKDVNKTLSPGGLTDIDKKVTGMLEWLLDSFKDCLAKAQKLKRSLTSVLERGEEVAIPCPEQLIFDWATQMSQQAAVDEMSGISKASYKSYKHAFRLFQLLKLEAQEAKDSYDEQVLSSCMAQVSLRAEHCKQQLSRA
jgi:hypothetical protein